MPFDWISKLQRLLQTLAFCLALAAVQSFVDDRGRPYWIPMVYSLAIGTASWALIDFGRHAFPSAAETGWPTGWAAFALAAGGLVGGFLIGTAIGDWACGGSSWAPAARPRLVLSVVISTAAGVAVTYYYYSRMRGQFLERRMVEARRQEAETRLKLLESQLEPHMLFNTLANLRVLIGLDSGRAQAMLDHLIAFLRSTLGASRATLHPLQSEFERLADYLALMEQRMGARLQVRLELPADLRGALLPPLLLQPLVENAIKHGLEPKVGSGRIEVRASRDGDTLVIDVRDTGVGLPDGTAARHSAGGAGVGTALVRERLAAAAGAAGSLSLRPAGDAGGGTVAQVRLPLRTAADSDAVTTTAPT